METQTQRTWQTIISSKEYKEAQKTGKIVDFVTYKEDETIDNNANYFLMEINEGNFLFVNSIKSISIHINDKEILEVASASQYTFPSQELDLPLFCFTNENVSSIEDLNFNQLKKCEKNQQKKYIVVFLGNNSVQTQKEYLTSKNFSEWHAKKPEVKLEIFELWNNSAFNTYKGKMLKIFHKDYQLTNTN